ncbi:unnamed protein product [[Candida] boidinii]|nr:unnamed protein product [[Candida] boidinii]
MKIPSHYSNLIPMEAIGSRTNSSQQLFYGNLNSQPNGNFINYNNNNNNHTNKNNSSNNNNQGNINSFMNNLTPNLNNLGLSNLNSPNNTMEYSNLQYKFNNDDSHNNNNNIGFNGSNQNNNNFKNSRNFMLSPSFIDSNSNNNNPNNNNNNNNFASPQGFSPNFPHSGLTPTLDGLISSSILLPNNQQQQQQYQNKNKQQQQQQQQQQSQQQSQQQQQPTLPFNQLQAFQAPHQQQQQQQQPLSSSFPTYTPGDYPVSQSTTPSSQISPPAILKQSFNRDSPVSITYLEPASTLTSQNLQKQQSLQDFQQQHQYDQSQQINIQYSTLTTKSNRFKVKIEETNDITKPFQSGIDKQVASNEDSDNDGEHDNEDEEEDDVDAEANVIEDDKNKILKSRKDLKSKEKSDSNEETDSKRLTILPILSKLMELKTRASQNNDDQIFKNDFKLFDENNKLVNYKFKGELSVLS